MISLSFDIEMLCNYQCQADGEGRGGRGDFDRSLWPWGRAFELSCCPGGKDINYFLGWGISVIFDLTYLPGGREFYSNFLENVKIQPYAPLPAL